MWISDVALQCGYVEVPYHIVIRHCLICLNDFQTMSNVTGLQKKSSQLIPDVKSPLSVFALNGYDGFDHVHLHSLIMHIMN